MSIRMGRLAGLWATALVITACGGGGGGGQPLRLTLSPDEVTVTVLQGQSQTFNTTGTVTGTVEGVVNVLIVDTVGVIEPEVQILNIGGNSYTATFTTAAGLAPNSYTGDISIRLCGSTPPACNPEYGSANLGYNITVQAIPVPSITAISPAQSTAAGPGFTLTVNGSGYFPDSVVNWSGQPLATSFVSPTQLRATVTSAELADGGTRAITVTTPPPGGGTSASVSHTVLNPAPSLTAVNPLATTAGCGSFTLGVAGSNFVPSSVVRWQGTPLATTFESSTYLRATVPGSFVASPGGGAVTVVSPAAGGGTSGSRDVAIDATSGPANQAVTLQIDAAHTGVAHTPCPTTPAAAPRWDVPVGGDASFALVAGGRVFVTVAGLPGLNPPVELLALDGASGATLWGPLAVADNLNTFARAYAAWANDVVYVAANADPGLPIDQNLGARPASVQAYEGASGNVRWRRELARNTVNPDVVGIVPANGKVYVRGRSAVGILEAFDPSTGAQLFQAGAGFGSASWPTVTASSVIITGDCATEAFSATTGGLQWQQAPVCSGGGGGVAVVSGGLVYSATRSISGSTVEVYAANGGAVVGAVNGPGAVRDGIGYGPSARLLATNTLLWSYALDPVAFGDPDIGPLLVNDLVITGNRQRGRIYALDAATGTLMWQLDVGASDPFGTSTITEISVGENLLVVSRGDRVKAWRIGSTL